METVFARLTVYFDDPFWVGVYERQENGRLSACRMVFGAEPKDYEVYAYMLTAWSRLRFSPPVEAQMEPLQAGNPKRRQRAIRRALERPAGSTKSQQALQAGRELAAQTRKTAHREQAQAEKERKFQLRQQKKKEKHRGG
ncbi:MAG: YjdF family protein [Butyricicoccus sp.]